MTIRGSGKVVSCWVAGFCGLLLSSACQPAHTPLTVSNPPPSASAQPPTAATPSTAPAPAREPAVDAAPASAHCFACADGRLALTNGWWLQSSAKVKAGGKDLSLPGYALQNWYPATVPTTVLAALVAAGVYPDPYAGSNFQAIPSAAFAGSFWYRTEFTLPADFAGQEAWLNFDGINYRANVWLNGERVADAKELVGTFTSHEWNVTARVRPGQPNSLAVEVFAPDLKRDLALSWLDWNPAPADRDMGIWRAVYLKRSGPVQVRGARVLSKLDLATLSQAELTIKAELSNTTDQALRTTVEGSLAPSAANSELERVTVSQEVQLAPKETKTIVFEPRQFAALSLKNPRLWWPAQMGAQNQYDLTLRASSQGRLSDSAPVRFGIRDVSFELEPHGARVFRINGRRILVRGGGWASDMLLRESDARLETEFSLVRDLGLNTIRLEGKLESDDFYAKADAYGILVIPGWMCCDRWQESASWSKAEHQIGIASMAAQARRLVNHPSVIDFLIGSDEAPTPSVEREFVAELRKVDWQAAISPAASARTTPLLGKSGVKMTGPYDWVSPAYWYQDHEFGGGFGYNSETSPGPSIPELDSLRAWLSPAELQDLWSKPNARLLHAGTRGTRFDNLSVFNHALAARHGKPTSLEDYVLKAELMNYEGERAMFEAYARNKYASATGVVQWLLNNAWPSLIWHLYGYDFSTAGAYFGAKKANEPVHIQYSYDDHSVVVVNHTFEAVAGLTASVEVYDSDSKPRFAEHFPIAVGPDATAKVMVIPELAGLSRTYFVRLRLQKDTSEVSQNWYWLSQIPELSAFRRTDWDYTPVTQFSDFTELARLSPAVVKATMLAPQGTREQVLRVVLENSSPSIAFFLHLKLTRGVSGTQVLPALWQDNYLSLLPGEKREVAVSYPAAQLAGATPNVEIAGNNVARVVANRE